MSRATTPLNNLFLFLGIEGLLGGHVVDKAGETCLDYNEYHNIIEYSDNVIIL
jgi:hypothetical protein